MALTTTGNLITFGEQVDSQSSATSSMRTRTFKNWRVLWGLGAKLPIPDSSFEDGFRTMDERIVSFSWAKEIAPGRALLAYLNDMGQIVVMSIQYHRRRDSSKRGSEQEWVWTLTEHIRIDGRGPHKEVSPPPIVSVRALYSLVFRIQIHKIRISVLKAASSPLNGAPG